MLKNRQFPLLMGLLCALLLGCTGGIGSHRHAAESSAGPQASAPTAHEQAGSTAVKPVNFETDNPPPLQRPSTSIKVTEAADAEEVPLPPGTSTQRNSAQTSVAASSSAPEPMVTIHADDLAVRKVLEMLSREAKTSIVVSSGISKETKVTMDIQNRGLNEALGIIAKLCDLDVRHEGGVIFISTMAETRAAEEKNLPIRIYHLNYAKSSDVLKMITPFKSKKGMMTATPDAKSGLATGSVGGSSGGSGGSGGGSGGGGGGGGGSSSGGSEGNTMAGGEMVIVQDYEDILKQVDKLVAQIDVQPAQVMIEAVILGVQLKKGMDLGASFALMDQAGKTLGEVGDGAVINAATGFAPATVVTSAGKLVSGFAGDDYGLKFGFIGQNGTAFIKALESMSDTKVLAAPRLLVLNKQQACVQLGAQLGFQNSTTTQTATTMSFQQIPVGTILSLRPFISSDGMVRLDVSPQRATGSIDKNNIPQTNTAQVSTNVLIPDGQTLVIGGLIDEQVDHGWDGFPFLSRIPFLGYLFRHTKDSYLKQELVVMLTVKIVHSEAPDAANYWGKPKSLGLQKRISQQPMAEATDGPTMFELVRPEQNPPGGPMEPILQGQRAVEQR
jgi:general secretion pathway protein D